MITIPGTSSNGNTRGNSVQREMSIQSIVTQSQSAENSETLEVENYIFFVVMDFDHLNKCPLINAFKVAISFTVHSSVFCCHKTAGQCF